MSIPMKGIQTLARDFYENQGMCKDPVILQVGQEAYFVDISLIDPETDFYAIIPCVVVAVSPGRFPNRWYYTLKAKDSKLDEALNTINDPDVGLVYRYTECTNPCLFDVQETIDRTETAEE